MQTHEGNVRGRAKRVRIYVNEGHQYEQQPLPLAILRFLRKERAAGATVLRGFEGFGAAGEIHTLRLLELGQPLPMIIDWVDTPEQVDRLLPRVKDMLKSGFITVEDTEIVFCRPCRVHDVADGLLARDVMCREVLSVAPEEPVSEMVKLLVGKSYRALPVVKDGIPVGIVTNTDLLTRAALGVRLDLLPTLKGAELGDELLRLAQGGKTANDVMTPKPLTVAPDTPLSQVAETMATHRLKRLPVVDGQGRMVGIVSRFDVLNSAAGGLRRASEGPAECGFAIDLPVSVSMRREVASVLAEAPWPEVLQAVISTRLNRCLVVDRERRVLGQVTDAELLERITPALRPGMLKSLIQRLPFAHPTPEEADMARHALARSAAELMAPTLAVGQDMRLKDAIALMLGGKHKLVAVVDADKRLVGCLDRADMLRGLLAAARP